MDQSLMEKNKLLIEEFPFLIPRNVWTGKIVEDYDYSYTLLDNLEDGWRIRFGLAFCKDLKEVLEKNNCLDDYYIYQIKEKFGQLRWYDNSPQEWSDHMYAWEYISEHTCKRCGKFPVPMRDDGGWVSPWCDDCFGYWRKTPFTEDEKKKWALSDPCNGRLLEYLEITRYSKDGDEIRYIDMKPYYDKIGYKYENLVTKEEVEQYKTYEKCLKEWEDVNGKIKNPQIIPYEIRILNPFLEDIHGQTS